MKLQKITVQKQHFLFQSERVNSVYSPSTPVNLREFLVTQAEEFRNLGRKSFQYERLSPTNATQSGAYTPASNRKIATRKRLLVYRQYVYLEVEIPSRFIIEWDACLGLSHEQYISTKYSLNSREYQYRFYYICTLTPGVRVKEVKPENIQLDSRLLYKPELLKLLADMIPSNRDSKEEYCLHHLIRDVAIPMKCFFKKDARGLYKPAEQLREEQEWGAQPRKRKRRRFKAC